MSVYVSVIEFREFNRKKRNVGPLSHHCEINITSITCILKDIILIVFDVISFQHVLHFDVGRSEIVWNLKVNFQFLHRAKSCTKHHSKRLTYIESATVLSDKHS